MTSATAATKTGDMPNSGTTSEEIGHERTACPPTVPSDCTMKVGQTSVVIVQRLSAPESTLPLYRSERSVAALGFPALS